MHLKHSDTKVPFPQKNILIRSRKIVIGVCTNMWTANPGVGRKFVFKHFVGWNDFFNLGIVE